jgi:hypothetical protein
MRYKLLLVGAATIVTAVLLSLPQVYWPLMGRLRGEAFYAGFPTSYYEARARCLRQAWTLTPDGCVVGAVTWRRPVGVLADLRQSLNLRVQSVPAGDADLLPTDPAAVPVLVEILGRNAPTPPNVILLTQAADAAGRIGPPARDAVPALRRLADGLAAPGGQSPWEQVVRDALRRIDSAGE